MKAHPSKLFFTITLLLGTVLLYSCRKENLARNGPVEFSEDTISFDTLFTTFQSPTQRLYFFNPGGTPLRIDEIYLDAGPASDFSLIIDGAEQQSAQDYILNPHDSALVFIKLRSVERNTFSRDYLTFKSGSNIQKVVLEAYLLDAYFYSNTVLPCGMVFDETKPVVIDGIVQVAYGCDLTILPGAKIYFTSKKDADFNLISMLDVQGSLSAQGMPGFPIEFSGSRLDGDYPETGSQWRGIRFGVNSVNNVMEYCLIKNGLFGIEVDSASVSSINPKVRLRQCEIRNMAAYGIWTLGFGPGSGTNQPQVIAQNVLVHNCQQANFAMIAGGDAEFYNCTFASYSIDYSRRSAQLGLTNYWEDSITTLYPARARFHNCIVWGSEEEEVVLDSVEGYPGWMDVEFHSCILKTTQDFRGSAIQKNADPLFAEPVKVDPHERNYRLESSSPAIDAGQDFASWYHIDLDGGARDANFDLGCFEFRP